MEGLLDYVFPLAGFLFGVGILYKFDVCHEVVQMMKEDEVDVVYRHCCRITTPCLYATKTMNKIRL